MPQGGIFTLPMTASPDAWREIITHVAPFLGMQVVVPAPAGATRERRGRTAARIPDDSAPLVDTIRTAYASGSPYHKTGRNGLFSRRAELPAGFSDVGRDRLERLVDGMMRTSVLTQDEAGALAVPDNPS